jgi:hypothetical protein
MDNIKKIANFTKKSDKNYLIKVTEDVHDYGTHATIDYEFYSGASMPSAFIHGMLAKDRFKFEEEIKDAVKNIFKKYKHLEV